MPEPAPIPSSGRIGAPIVVVCLSPAAPFADMRDTNLPPLVLTMARIAREHSVGSLRKAKDCPTSLTP